MKKVLLVVLVLMFVDRKNYLQFHNKLFVDVSFWEIVTITPIMGLRIYCNESPEVYSLYYRVQGELTLGAFYFRLEHGQDTIGSISRDETVVTNMLTIGAAF